jgi:hypothetical protein
VISFGLQLLVGLAAAALAQPVSSTDAAGPTWRPVQDGVEYAVLGGKELGLGPGELIHGVRIDPARAPLVAAMASATDRRARTAAAWCRDRGLAVAINLGMYREDFLTNVGHARTSRHTNNRRWSKSYKSVLLFEPRKKNVAAALMVDLDAPDAQARLADYGAAVQNLRLIRAPGVSVWTPQARRWSEAAVAMDRQGRILFLFTPRPYDMAELNAKLLALPLELTHAMHVEGGPKASLSIHGGGIDLDLSGNYETGAEENDANVEVEGDREGDGERTQWPMPNALGVARK